MNGCMASACAISMPLAVTAPSACPLSKNKKTAAVGRCRRRTVPCRATTGDGGGRGCDNDSPLWLPRRDVMLTGLSSAAAAAGLAWYPAVASGADSSSSTSSPCNRADPVNETTLECTDTSAQAPCPPGSPAAPVNFTPERTVTRVRQAAHLLSRENQEKYKEAVARMKALPASHPLSFAAQADIHEAYCDSYYHYRRGLLTGSSATATTTGSSSSPPAFDVHFSWLFGPWHRMYIYFYERALGELIGDAAFALPFWNWDHPAGMGIPAIFKEGPLHDPNRNRAHADALIDLDYINTTDKTATIPFSGSEGDEEYKKAVNKNLCVVYNQQVRSGRGALAFQGEKYCTDIGSSMSSQGSLERMAHSAVHVWTGKAGGSSSSSSSSSTTSTGLDAASTPLGCVLDHTNGGYTCTNDMGFLGSAGRDPLFYSHHSNVDRLWHIWSTRLGGGQGITDPDWLGTSFVFYDGVENPRKVRVTFRDVLDTRDLGYIYDPESDRDLPWLRPKITPLVPRGGGGAPAARSKAAAPVFPVVLAKGRVVVVPAVAVPATEPGTEQVLVIEGIEFDPQANNKFDVAINVPKDKALQVGPQYREYAGSFAVVPGSGGGGTRRAKLSLCITDVLFDIEADGDKTVDVVIVPRSDAKITLNNAPTIKNRE